MTTDTTPEFETLVLERLALCFLEIPGIQRTFVLQPAQPIPDDELPAAYAMPKEMTGPMDVNGSEYSYTRRYFVDVLVMPAEQGVDEGNLGAEPSRRCLPLLWQIPRYFAQHPLLATALQESLDYCDQVTYRDGGIGVLPGPGGAKYAGLRLTFDITMSTILETVRY